MSKFYCIKVKQIVQNEEIVWYHIDANSEEEALEIAKNDEWGTFDSEVLDSTIMDTHWDEAEIREMEVAK